MIKKQKPVFNDGLYAYSKFNNHIILSASKVQ